ncbi:MAG: hypothetical protein JW913_13945 [Chitinispirillaceae bacterium]|nr:hypothetical protein [Chitinispirillaceae bacterium]
MSRKCRQVLWAMQGIILTALVSLFFTVPGNVSAAAAATIDEKQPSSFPGDIVSDWKAKDGTNYSSLISSIKNSLPSKYKDNVTGSGEQGYLSACHWRRVARLSPYAKELKKMVYARHHDIGGAIIGYTEDLNGTGRGFGPWGMCMGKSSDYSKGNQGGTAIHLLEFDDYYPKPSDIIAPSKGCVRDPCPTYKGNKLVYAYSEDNNGYHLYDIDLATKKTRQLTFDPEGIEISDMEPCVTPSGDIIFCSSRCFQHVDCNINLVSNLFICDCDGKWLRRISYDQVNIFNPTMMEDGTVMYNRWEYNDKNVANVMGIFTMNQDGTRQNEFFGNQSSTPATFQMARAVPGNTMMAVSTLGGHMGPHAGDICLVNAAKARNGTGPLTMICPKGRSVSGGGFNMTGPDDSKKLFQNPYPLDETCMLVSYRKTRSSRFQVFWMDFDGNRELIASGGSQSVSQPISLMERDIPIVPTYQADYSKKTGVLSVVDVYYGETSVSGMTKGEVKKIRVVAMEYRTDPAHGNTGSSSYQMGPVGRFGCSWEAKWICGEVDVEDDGSAAFEVPARTPIFLQLINKDGVCVQTMRSWMTLQPGERFDCMGCHEDKNAAPLDKTPKAIQPVALKPFFDLPQEKGSFYFLDVIQPILDANCVKSGCHDDSHSKLKLKKNIVDASTLGNDEKNAYRKWSKSYYNLSEKSYCNYNCIFGGAEGIRAKSIGSPKSKLITQLLGGHKSLSLKNGEIDKLAAWIDLGVPHSGTYTDDMPSDVLSSYNKRMERRVKEEAIEAKNIQEFIDAGGYNQKKYRDLTAAVIPEKQTVTQKAVSVDAFKVRFLSTERMLSLNLPSEGKIKLLDLMGRQILSRSISRDAFLESAQQNVKLNIPAGTYIVKFDGVKVTGEEMVSIL